MTVLHCADLHLTADPAEKDYGLHVLQEIVGLVGRFRPTCVLFSGDVFDSFPDLERLAAEFRGAMADLGDCLPVMIPGNHESLRIATHSLANREWGGIRFVHQGPVIIPVSAALELLVVPHRDSYADYLEWEVPAKVAHTRILVGHGMVAGVGFAGPDEEGAGALDPDLFDRYEVDVAAMGHIHAPSEVVVGRTRVCYPGSARVWRRGESGPRGVWVIEIGDEPVLRRVALKSAGEYRAVDLPLPLDGSAPDMGEMAAGWGPRDWIDLRLSGVVDRQDILAKTVRELKQGIEGSVRRLDVEAEGVLTMEGIAAQPLAQRFLESWKLREPEDQAEREVWLRSREIGLTRIKQALEARG